MRRRLPVAAASAFFALALLLAACTSAKTASSPSTQHSGSGATSSSPTTIPTTQPGSLTGASRPNIVFVLTDDLSWNLVSHMPQVLELQRAGTTLSNYYVVDSLCCPSRTAILTGQYPHDDGVFTNDGADGGYPAYRGHDDQLKQYSLSLQRAGYRTGFMGKYINGYLPSDPPDPGWNEWDVAGDGYGEYNYFLNENGKRVRYGHRPKDYMVDVLSGKAGAFIDSSAAAHKPFMLEVATFAPHAPYIAAPRYQGAASLIQYPKTPAYDTLPINPPSWLKARAPLTKHQKEHELEAYRKRVDADLAVDDLIANVKRHLQAAGVANNTYIVFSSDNGYHMGEYRLLEGKQTAFDTDIHVPLVITGPGVSAGYDSTQLASNIDLAATFETLTGSRVGSTMDGTTLTPLFTGSTAPDWQQAVLIEHHGPNDLPGDPDRQGVSHADPPSYEAIRTADALYVQYDTGEEEYYDLADDPYELHNLGPSAVPEKMRTMLTELERCHGTAACQQAAGA